MRKLILFYIFSKKYLIFSPVDPRWNSFFLFENLRSLKNLYFRNVWLYAIFSLIFFEIWCMQGNSKDILMGAYSFAVCIKILDTASFKLIIFNFILNWLVWNLKAIMKISMGIFWAWFLKPKRLFSVDIFFIFDLILKRDMFCHFIFVIIFPIKVILFAFFLFLWYFWIVRVWRLMVRYLINAKIRQYLLCCLS